MGNTRVAALDRVDLSIDAGEYLSIMGPSGSGKSTLLHTIGLLDRPTQGTYQLDGRTVSGLSDDEQAAERLMRFGFVFQFFHLVPRLTAAENVGLPLTLAGIPHDQAAPRVADALARCGLGDRADHRPDQLSGGQRQRVAIARAIIMRPQVILADEPTGNLDRTSGTQVIELIEDLHSEGITLIVVTHDADIGRRAMRLIRVVDGKIAEDKKR
ncbi:MAG: ABC transporter ATP-binding protein [Leptospirillia bacterium]